MKKLYVCLIKSIILTSLSLFRNFNPFRVLICGGDGSISWVLSEVDRMNLSSQVSNFLKLPFP